MLPQEVGETNELQTGQICSQIIHRCILQELGCTLQYPYDDCGYKDIRRETNQQKHPGSLGLPNQRLLLPASGRRVRQATGLVQGHYFHTSQSYHPANIQQDTPPSTFIQPDQILFIFSKQIIKTKTYLYTFHQYHDVS